MGLGSMFDTVLTKSSINRKLSKFEIKKRTKIRDRHVPDYELFSSRVKNVAGQDVIFWLVNAVLEVER
jgi:hypothetical protein